MFKVPAFATADPANGMTESSPGSVRNLAAGFWAGADHDRGGIIDPMHGQRFLRIPDTANQEPFILGLRSRPESGLHNPLKNPDRYLALGAIGARAAGTGAPEATIATWSGYREIVSDEGPLPDSWTITPPT